MESTIEGDGAREEHRRWSRRWKDHFMGVLLTVVGVAYLGRALFMEDFVDVVQGLGMTGLGVHFLRRKLPIDMNLRDTFRTSAGQPYTVEDAMSAAIALTLVAAGALGRFLEWVWS